MSVGVWVFMFLLKFSDILFSDFNIIYIFLFQSKIFLAFFKKNISKIHPKSKIGTLFPRCQMPTGREYEVRILPSHTFLKKGWNYVIAFLLHIHRNLLSALCFSSCMKFSFRGHSCGFTPSTGIHFPSLGLNRAGHDTSFTIVTRGPGTILVLMCSQFVQKWYMLIYGILYVCNYQV